MKVVLFGFTPVTALGITTAFSKHPDLCSTTPILSAAQLVQTAAIGTVRLLLIDPRCPTLDAGLSLCREIKRFDSPPMIVAFGGFDGHVQVIFSALDAADSFVSATESAQRLTEVSLSTLQGKREWLLGPPAENLVGGPPPSSGLTRRENEILWQLFQRCTNEQIARSLGISPATVKNHVASILRKTGAKRRTELCSGALAAAPEYGPQPVSRTVL